MVGLLVMSIIMAIAVPNMRGMTNRAKEQSLRQTLYTLRSAVSRVREDTGNYPVQLTDLTLRTAPTNMRNNTGTSVANPQPTNWRGPYLQSIPVDPVSNANFNYSINSSGLFSVTSSATGSDSAGKPFTTY